MHERELSNLLIRISLERGVDIEHATRELAAMALPSFVDGTKFRSSLAEAVETQLQRQTDERIRKLRQQLGVEPAVHGRVNLPSPPPEPETTNEQIAPQEEAKPADDLREGTIVSNEDLPEDATMIWESRKD
jgi:hypothetical protein